MYGKRYSGAEKHFKAIKSYHCSLILLFIPSPHAHHTHTTPTHSHTQTYTQLFLSPHLRAPSLGYSRCHGDIFAPTSQEHEWAVQKASERERKKLEKQSLLFLISILKLIVTPSLLKLLTTLSSSVQSIGWMRKGLQLIPKMLTKDNKLSLHK